MEQNQEGNNLQEEQAEVVQDPEIQKKQEKTKEKSSGGILLPFLIVLLVLVGIADIALASYIGVYYFTTGKQQNSYSTSTQDQQQAQNTQQPNTQAPQQGAAQNSVQQPPA